MAAASRVLPGIVLLALAAAAPTTLAALAPSAATDVFEPPSRKDMKEPVYPRARQAQGREGWVRLNFMIDPRGKPYEVAVIDSTGDEQFERSAVRAVERSTFEPALLNGAPIDAGYDLKIKFSLVGGRNGASAGFVSDYRELTEAVEGGDQDAAVAALERMAAQTLYEDAYYNLARYNYAVRWGDLREQRRALSRAVADEQEDGYLPEDVFVWAQRSLFSLQIQAQDYGAALNTWRTLEGHGFEPPVRARLERAAREIEALRDDDRAYAVRGDLGARRSWFIRLLKNRFRVDQVQGEVAEVKLRCDRKYATFRHQPDLIYTVSDRYGDCRLEVVGEPGTTFRLVQS